MGSNSFCGDDLVSKKVDDSSEVEKDDQKQRELFIPRGHLGSARIRRKKKKEKKTTAKKFPTTDDIMEESEADHFRIKHIKRLLLDNVRALKDFSSFTRHDEEEEIGPEINSLFDLIYKDLQELEKYIDQLFKFAEERGIQEGINGYRSVLYVAVTVLENLFSSAEKYQAIYQHVTNSMHHVLSTYVTMYYPEDIRKWMIYTKERIKQLETINAISKAVLEFKTDDLFVFEDADHMIQRVKTIPTHSFYGIEFGSHLPSYVKNFLRFVMVANTSYSKAKLSKASGLLHIGMKSLVYGAFFSIFPQEVAQTFRKNEEDSDVHTLKEFWNITESLPSKPIFHFMRVDKEFAIPPIPFEMEWNSKKYTINPPILQPSLCDKKHISKAGGEWEPFCIVRARLLSHWFVSTSLEEEFDFLKKKFHENPHKEETEMKDIAEDEEILADSLIIHFHGGGFIAQGVNSHLSYLRQWAVDIEHAPILSIDYSLAPEFPFPIAISECYWAYLWALKNCKRLGSKGKKIVLAGDSAGGNIAVVVTTMALIDGMRIPDALVLLYPAMFMQFIASPSRSLAVIDPLLPLSTLKKCVTAYVPSEMKQYSGENFFISPALAPDELFKKFPDENFLMVGTLDPLFDDSIYFCKKMFENGKNVDVKILDGLGHGFICFTPACPELLTSSQQASFWIKRFLDKTNKSK